MKSAMRHNIFKEIKTTFSRFMAIFAIVALGVGFFAGLKATTPDMKATTDRYFDDNNLMDIRLLSTMGFTEKDAETLKMQPGIKDVMPTYNCDVLIESSSGISVARIHALPQEGSKYDNINVPVLVEGRLPQNAGECAIDKKMVSSSFGQVGSTITLSDQNSQDTMDLLNSHEFTVTGIVDSPYYISFQRGTASIGNGNISCFMIVPEEDFSSDYYLELFATVDGASELLCYSDDYDDLIEKAVDDLSDFVDSRKTIRYEEIVAEANSKLEDARRELADKRSEADEKLAEAQKELEDGRRKISDGEKELSDSEDELKRAEDELASQMAEYDEKFRDAEAQLAKAKSQIDSGLKMYNTMKTKVDQGEEQLSVLYAQIDAAKEAGNLEEVERLNSVVSKNEKELSAVRTMLDSQLPQLQSAQSEYTQKMAEFTDGKAEADSKFKEARQKIDDGYGKLEDGKAELVSAREDLANGQKEYDEQKADVELKLAEAQEDIDEASIQIEELDEPEWYVLSRNTNPGYVGFGSDSERIDAVASVFPVFFFLVAALICLTTMTRMVEEQRTQIGILKALGYGKGTIAAKYMIYAGTASIAGSLVGLAVGFWIFPTVIWQAYSILYNLPAIILSFNVKFALISSLAAVLCTSLATLWACYNELVCVPADLIRPKAPPAGKRVLLERISGLWNKLSFSQKVAARNLFRYKKRFFMTVIGIGGCTALLLTGFGLRDSISNIVSHQFGEIHKYDMIISLADAGNSQDGNNLNDHLNELTGNSLYVMQSSIDAISPSGEMINTYIFVPEDADKLNDFVSFRTRIGKDPVQFPSDGKAVITEKLATQLKVSVGDEISLKESEFNQVNVTVGGITENYIYNYVYMAPDYYESTFNEKPEYKQVLAHFTDRNNVTEEDEENVSKQILKLENVSSISFTTKLSRDFGNIMRSLDSVVLLLIICANLLAFVVMYNLTNINITERTREIATIKVLGFFDNEVSAYVYRENVILTLIGVLAGLVGGIFLHRFVVLTAEVDIVMFERSISVMSYVLSALLTFVFAGIVNLLMNSRLKRISMVESLKSIE